MTSITFLCQRYLKEVQTSEMYMTAQRTVKTGLVASAIVSSWTWAATLLTSTEVAYKYGVSVRKEKEGDGERKVVNKDE
jgi:Na+/proline symporter